MLGQEKLYINKRLWGCSVRYPGMGGFLQDLMFDMVIERYHLCKALSALAPPASPLVTGAVPALAMIEESQGSARGCYKV